MNGKDHTRAPWRNQDLRPDAVNSTGKIFAGIPGSIEAQLVATVHWPRGDDQEEKSKAFEANCRLIERAPEMLVALEAMYVSMKLGVHVDRDVAMRYSKQVLEYVKGQKIQ